MKDWKTILLEQIIRENLTEQQVRVVTKSIAIGSDATLNQFNASDKEWINKLPVKPVENKYDRVYVKIKSNVTGTVTPGSVPASERIKKVKDFLDDNTVKTQLATVDKDWIWIISDPETSRLAGAGPVDDPNNPGAQVFMIAGMRKADINNFDTGLNKITPAHGKLLNGNLVYSEAQIAELKTLSSKPKPTPEPVTTDIFNVSVIASKLTDVRELQKYLYAYFNKNVNNLPPEMVTFLNEYMRENYNVSTGDWSGNLNNKTRELADIFATATADEHKFNYPTGVNQLVEIDPTFRTNLAKSYAPLQLESKVIQRNTLLTEVDWTKAKPIETKEDENGILVKVTPPEEKKKVTPVVQGGDGKKKVTPSPTPVTDPTDLNTKEIATLLNQETTYVNKNVLLLNIEQPDRKKSNISTLEELSWYIHKIDISKNPKFKYPGNRANKKIIPYAVRFISSGDSNIRFTVYGIIEGNSFKTEAYSNTWNKHIVPSAPDNIIYHPYWYNEHVTSSKRWENYYTTLFLKKVTVPAVQPAEVSQTVILDKSNFTYDKLTKVQKTVGKLYAGSAEFGTYEDTLLTGIYFIKNYADLVKVIEYMKRMETTKDSWFIPANMSVGKFMDVYKADTSLIGYNIEATGEYNDAWPGRWLPTVGFSYIYKQGTVTVSNATYTSNSFCEMILGEFDLDTNYYKKIYDYFSKNSKTFKLKIYSWGLYNKRLNFILPKPE